MLGKAVSKGGLAVMRIFGSMHQFGLIILEGVFEELGALSRLSFGGGFLVG